MSNIYSVSQINGYIKNLFQQDFMLNRISVRGEVSNCKYHRSGHIYFTLKDQTSALACVMFASARKGLAFSMRDGDRVVVTGSVDIYERDGRYQMYARSIVKEGSGVLYERFLALKAELEEMGMFAEEYKQPIPSFIKTLGIVTAPTGAAVQDIRNIAGRRNPYVQLILYPALVQGAEAADSIVRGIRTLDALHPDVIIVGRGGGSLEDLWAFNEEKVARAVFECNTPIISAVGHETDTTITDFAADLRAPTPSAAAELAVPDIRLILEKRERLERQLQSMMQRSIQGNRQQLELFSRRWMLLSPENQIREKRQRITDLEEMFQNRMEERIQSARSTLEESGRRIEEQPRRILDERRHQLQLRIQRIKGCSPLDRLNQGYAYIEKDGAGIKSVSQVSVGEQLKIQFADGAVSAQVTAVKQQTAFLTEEDR